MIDAALSLFAQRGVEVLIHAGDFVSPFALAPLAEVAAPGLHLVNAGDGARSHPTQALLDLVTLEQHAGPLDQLIVVVAGDLHHSRVTRSGAALLKTMGVGELRLCAPPGLEAGPKVSVGDRCFDSLDEALVGADVVMMPATALGKDLAPRLAVRMDGAVAPDVTEISVDGGDITAVRPVYAGNAIVDIQAPEDVTLVATVNSNVAIFSRIDSILGKASAA